LVFAPHNPRRLQPRVSDEVTLCCPDYWFTDPPFGFLFLTDFLFFLVLFSDFFSKELRLSVAPFRFRPSKHFSFQGAHVLGLGKVVQLPLSPANSLISDLNPTRSPLFFSPISVAILNNHPPLTDVTGAPCRLFLPTVCRIGGLLIFFFPGECGNSFSMRLLSFAPNTEIIFYWPFWYVMSPTGPHTFFFPRFFPPVTCIFYLPWSHVGCAPRCFVLPLLFGSTTFAFRLEIGSPPDRPISPGCDSLAMLMIFFVPPPRYTRNHHPIFIRVFFLRYLRCRSPSFELFISPPSRFKDFS